MTRTRTVTVTEYRFAELSEKAKDRAKQRAAESIGYSWADEALDSIKALAKHFGGRMVDWSIDWFASSYSSARFDMPEMDRKEIAELLAELGTFDPDTLKGHGECKLTGVCFDEDAIDGFRRAFHAGESDLGELMDAAFDSWLKAAQADAEDQYSDEQFAENCEANDYWFTEDGELV